MQFTARSFAALVLTGAIVLDQLRKEQPFYALLWFVLLNRLFMKVPRLLHPPRDRFTWPMKPDHMS